MTPNAWFRDRKEAGRKLADALRPLQGQDLIVLALPRGGVPVALEVAEALGAPLDVLVVRKLGVPWQRELGFGAVGPGGLRVINHPLVASLEIAPEQVEEIAERQNQEREQRERRYRGDRPPPDVRGKVAVVVDDGIATGFTARAALETVRAMGAKRVVLAVPVSPPERVVELGELADDVVCLRAPEHFHAVGEAYQRFEQVSDDEVVAMLEDAGAHEVLVDVPGATLEGSLTIPADAQGLVLFVHGSGSGRHSPRNREVAARLRDDGYATLLVDLLTPQEAAEDAITGHLRFDLQLLSERVAGVVGGIARMPDTATLPLGLFGSSTGAAAALAVATRMPDRVRAVVSRGGRPDLVRQALPGVEAPTLFLVGGTDTVVHQLHDEVLPLMQAPRRLHIVPGAGHLFEEPGAMAEVATQTEAWFRRYLAPQATPVAAHGERRGTAHGREAEDAEVEAEAEAEAEMEVERGSRAEAGP